ncbi:zinc ribbon domain-containing protein [Candidatus Entotheonella palauensis]|uniref:zinc ribbon domain-containing protein n=1 Tax=Candidatus Entotheonella palauensis TaxID=93172 RepID=UPI0034DE2E19
MIRTQLEYKASRLAGFCVSVCESFSSVTCSVCLERTGPSGLGTLGVREWTCNACSARHDRDINAAMNILRLGR